MCIGDTRLSVFVVATTMHAMHRRDLLEPWRSLEQRRKSQVRRHELGAPSLQDACTLPANCNLADQQAVVVMQQLLQGEPLQL
jgi:hypothetical protein